MNKLQQMSALASVFLAGGKISDAQIQYTDIDPDLYTNSPFVYLDVDGDAVNDINFRIWWSAFFDISYSYAVAGNINPSLYIATNLLPGPNNGVEKFNEGDIINSTEQWADPGYFGQMLAEFTNFTYNDCSGTTHIISHGDFFDVSNKYLGFRIGVAGNYNYGWIRLSVPFHSPCPLPLHDGFEIFVHDFAINLTPNEPISAGEGIIGDCPPPAALPSLVATTYAKVRWEAVAEAEYYSIQYREAGAFVWNTKTFPAVKTSKLIKGLTCNTNYEWRVRSICGGGAVISDYCPLQTFTTVDCKIGDEDDLIPEINIYPNPADDFIYVDVDGIEEITFIEIFDITGKLIQTINATPNELLIIDISNFNSGIYILNIKGTSELIMRKFIRA